MEPKNRQEFERGDWVRNTENPGQKGTIQEETEDPSYKVKIGVAKFKIIPAKKLEKFDPQETIDELLEKEYYGHAHDLGKIIAYEELNKYSPKTLQNVKDARRILVFCSSKKDAEKHEQQIKQHFFENNIHQIETKKKAIEDCLKKIKSQDNSCSAIIIPKKIIETTDKTVSEPLKELVSYFEKNIQNGKKIFDLVIVSLQEAILEQLSFKQTFTPLSKCVCDDFDKAISSINNDEVIKNLPEIIKFFLNDNQEKSLFNPLSDSDKEQVYELAMEDKLKEVFKEYYEKSNFPVKTQLHNKEIECYFDSGKVSTEIRQNPTKYELLNISHPFIQWIQKEYQDQEKPWWHFHRLSAIELKQNETSDVSSGEYLYAVFKPNKEPKEIQYELKKIDNGDETKKSQKSPDQFKQIIQQTAFQKNKSPITKGNPNYPKYKEKIQEYKQDLKSNDILSLGIIKID